MGHNPNLNTSLPRAWEDTWPCLPALSKELSPGCSKKRRGLVSQLLVSCLMFQLWGCL